MMRLILPRQQPQESIENKEFIALRQNTTRKRKRSSLSSQPLENEGPDYRSIEGKAKPSFEPDDSELEYASHSSDGDNSAVLENALAARIKDNELHQRTKAEPSSLQAWLDYVNHQDNLILQGRSALARDLTDAERRSLAEIKLSIYKKALKSVTSSRPLQRSVQFNNSFGCSQERLLKYEPGATQQSGFLGGRTQLLLGMLHEGSKVWDAERLASAWEEATQADKEDLTLQFRYINFKQTSKLWTREDCQKAYLVCLKTMATAIEDLLNIDGNNDELEEGHIYMVLRFTTFTYEAGYHEDAIAIWQALLEFNFMRPTDLGLAEARKSFDAFWQSEVARIGEENAKGWVAFHQDPTQYKEPEPVNLIPNVDLDPQEPFKSWAHAERKREMALKYPGRTMDVAEEDDPFHVVLNVDPSCLVWYQAQRSLSLLIEAFLCFCRQPRLEGFGVARIAQRWRCDPFLYCTPTGQQWEQLGSPCDNLAVEACSTEGAGMNVGICLSTRRGCCAH